MRLRKESAVLGLLFVLLGAVWMYFQARLQLRGSELWEGQRLPVLFRLVFCLPVAAWGGIFCGLGLIAVGKDAATRSRGWNVVLWVVWLMAGSWALGGLVVPYYLMPH